MAKRIFITGIGLISAIGKDSDEAFANLKAVHSGVGNIEHLQTNHKGTMPLCEVKYTNEKLYQLAGVSTSR
ncbi:MAG: hypothetical protein MK212_22430, partial [Saprospiraceae bacterium]|nr:hypothetical protein [Saprospiraceae bacterium]